MSSKRLKIVADFETTTDKNDVRVWAVCAVDIETTDTLFISNSIDDFFEWLSSKNSVCYFHNLKFDGEFIISWLLKNGYTFEDTHQPRTFSTLITDSGIFYAIEVYFSFTESKGKRKYKKVVFYDSLKKLPFKVATIAQAFNLEDQKLEIDYDAPRAVGHVLTEQERKYIIADCRIVAQALKIQFEQGLKKMTNASDAMSWFKKLKGQYFEKYYPVFPIELDADIRRAYKGGFVYLNPKHKNKRGLQGITLDVNSLYPSVMYEKVLPFGYPIYFEGEPVDLEGYPLYIVRIRCAFTVKKGYIPTIQLKNNRAFIETEYLTSSGGEIVELTLTNVDLELFLDHYDVLCLEYVCGWRFKGKQGAFTEYIDHWSAIKANSTGALRQLAKLMLNSLYGKFATNPLGRKKEPYLDENGVVKYKLSEPEERDPVYTAMGAFITAYAREKTIRSAQAVYPRFIYADTDSLHLIGFDVPEGLEVHPSKLGAWKLEGEFVDSKFLRAKTYMETYRDGEELETKVTCAGMPDNVKALVTYDNFEPGHSFEGKLLPRRHPGGVVLEATYFTIK